MYVPQIPRKLLAALILLVVAAFPVVLLASHSWGGYHWARTVNPFTLKMDDNVDSSWQSAFNGAISDWSKSTVLDMTTVADGTRPKPCKATSGRVEVCNAAYGYRGWLALAQIWVSGGE